MRRIAPPTHSYYMLIASLPHMPPTFEVELVPISRIQLEKRLEMLRPADARIVDQILDFLQWDRQHRDQADEELNDHFDELMQTIINPLVRQIVAYRMDVRTIVSGLRRRRLGMSPPTGVGQWVDHIRQHWDDPLFKLVRDHPWIGQAKTALDEGNVLEVERQLLSATWSRWTKLAERFHFSFEAVILYLVRWEIVDRWTRLNAPLGRRKFHNLLMETLGDYAAIHDS